MESLVYFVQMDAMRFLAVQPDESINLLLTDPPYESMNKHRAIGTTTRMKQFFDTVPNSYFENWLKEVYRVMAKNSHGYIICDEETSDILKPLIVAAGFTYWKRLVWDKELKGMGYHWCNQHEFILFFEKGKRKLNHNSGISVLRYRGIRRQKKDPLYYPTEKSVDMLKQLITNSSNEGDMVLDCFMGGGSTLEACIDTNRRFIGCDTSEMSIRVSHMRLKNKGWNAVSNINVDLCASDLIKGSLSVVETFVDDHELDLSNLNGEN